MDIKGMVYIVGLNTANKMPIGIRVVDPTVGYPAPVWGEGVQVTLVGKYVDWPAEMSLAERLALNVLQGKTESAIILADALAEAHSGNVSDLQAEIKRRVDEAVATAVAEEREQCAKFVAERLPMTEQQSPMFERIADLIRRRQELTP